MLKVLLLYSGYLSYMSTKMLLLTGISEHACESYPPGFTFMASDTCSRNFEGKFLGYNGNWCLPMICSYLCVPFDYQGFCVEARTLRSLFQTFDMYVLYPHNSMLSFDVVILCLWLTLFLTCLEASTSCLCCRIES